MASRFVLRGWPAVAGVLLMAGCAQPPKTMYHWEGFQPQVYEHFKGDGSGPSEQLRVLEAEVQKAAGSNQALPPGFRAHLAMIYLRLGRDDEARLQLEAEKAAFPESAQYMDFLLQKANRKKS